LICKTKIKLRTFLSCIASVALLSGILSCGSSSSSPEEPEPPFAQKLSNFLITTKGVFFAVEVDSGRYELFCVDPFSAERHEISDEFSATRGLKRMAISPDTSRVAYRADKDFDGVDELYVNSLSGDAEVQVVSELPTTTPTGLTSGSSQLVSRINWQWSPDSTRIIYHSDFDNDGVFEIQSVLADGTGHAVVSGDISTQCSDESCWKVSPDGAYITFLSKTDNQNGAVGQNIYVANLEGENLTRLNQQLTNDSRIQTWLWNNDSNLVYYISQNVGTPSALYSVTPDAITRTLISQSGTSHGIYEFAFTAASNLIVFREDTNVADLPSLFIIGEDGLNRTELVDRFTVSNPEVTSWEWSPAAQRIAYVADQETEGTFELFTVETDGEWHRKLNNNLLPSGGLQSNWQWSDNGASIVYFADIETRDPFDELFVSDDDGSNIENVGLQLQADAAISLADMAWVADNSRVIYQVENNNQEIQAIYSVLSNGTNPQLLTGTLEAGDFIYSGFKISTDTNQILYRQFQQNGNYTRLNLSEVDGSVNRDLVTVGQVEYFNWTSDGSRVLYQIKLPGEISEQFYSILPNSSGRLKLY